VIFHPGIIALFLGSGVVVLMLLYISLLSVRVLRYWDIRSSSELQLSLERKTYLTSTIMNYILGYQIVSALLFIYTVDSLHTEFVGAMCATGVLNANPVGWYVLYLKVLNLIVSGLWIGINMLDQQSPDYPLTRLKSALILILLPLISLEAYLEVRYFLGLNPAVITSCCGSLFSAQGKGLASSLSAIPVKKAETGFALVWALFFISGPLSLKYNISSLKYVFSITSVLAFLVSLASVVSFISLYFYELPTHHCPFDILQADFHYVGYPLYISLFLCTITSMLTGLYEALRRKVGQKDVVDRLQRKMTLSGLLFGLLFLIISLWPMVFSSFTLQGY